MARLGSFRFLYTFKLHKSKPTEHGHPCKRTSSVGHTFQVILQVRKALNKLKQSEKA